MSNANAPAFPVPNEQRYEDPVHGVVKPSDIYGDASTGLTKREYLAAMAMQGLCANAAAYERLANREQAAQITVRIADALLAELEKEPGK